MAIYSYGENSPQIEESAWIFPSADIIGDVIIGKGTYIGAGAVLRGDYGTIIIEDGAAIEENVTIHASPHNACHVKKNAIIGHAAMLHGCTIESEAVIGMMAVITNDAIVGENAIIGEGAVVPAKMHIPAKIIAVGVPAKIIKPVPKNLLHYWKEVGKIYRQLALDYPQKLQRIS